MKIYLAGKISGNDEYKEQFAEAERRIYDVAEDLGIDVTVLNPATLPEGMSKSEYMRICFQMIDISDCVFLLDYWMESDGAVLEKDYCNYIGKNIERFKDGIAMLHRFKRVVNDEDFSSAIARACAEASENIIECMKAITERINEACSNIGGNFYDEHG